MINQQERIINHVKRFSGLSAYQVSNALGLKCNTVSAQLKTLTTKKVLTRKKGEGPRGGYTYYINKKGK